MILFDLFIHFDSSAATRLGVRARSGKGEKGTVILTLAFIDECLKSFHCLYITTTSLYYYYIFILLLLLDITTTYLKYLINTLTFFLLSDFGTKSSILEERGYERRELFHVI